MPSSWVRQGSTQGSCRGHKSVRGEPSSHLIVLTPYGGGKHERLGYVKKSLTSTVVNSYGFGRGREGISLKNRMKTASSLPLLTWTGLEGEGGGHERLGWKLPNLYHRWLEQVWRVREEVMKDKDENCLTSTILDLNRSGGWGRRSWKIRMKTPLPLPSLTRMDLGVWERRLRKCR